MKQKKKNSFFIFYYIDASPLGKKKINRVFLYGKRKGTKSAYKRKRIVKKSSLHSKNEINIKDAIIMRLINQIHRISHKYSKIIILDQNKEIRTITLQTIKHFFFWFEQWQK